MPVGLPYPVEGKPAEFWKERIDRYAVIYEQHNHTEKCIPAILPELGLPCKRESRSRQPDQSWEEA